MDGIEATKIIRGMGYANTIIALTANALIGRAEMFLKNGFDGFISKPIDSRELNFVLNDFIRNKKSPEVINAARQEHHENVQQGTKISEIRMFFIRDAENAVSILTDFYDRIDTLSDDEIHLYTTVVHGMKSALANIGEKDLSLVALKLEKAGDSRNLAVLSGETISFINELRSLIEKLKLEEENNAAENYGDGQASDINLIPEIHRTFLLEKLNEIKTACVEFDKKAAKAVLKELKQKTWPKHINNVLNIIVVNILHSELDEAAALAEKTVREFTL
jgi:CheY-like chemotaxis protein